VLESFPRPLTKIFVPERPEERGHENDHGDEVMRGERLADYRVVFGNGLFGHQILLKTFAFFCKTLGQRAKQRKERPASEGGPYNENQERV